MLICVFFFLQAEDGIRDVAVTGVQTCALPISLEKIIAARGWDQTEAARSHHIFCIRDEVLNTPAPTLLHGLDRSEEHTSELQSRLHLVCRLLLEKKNKHSSVSSELS